MFLRRFQKRKNGKTHVYWALVETYRTAKGPRQRIVSYLGELKESERSGWAQLASKLDGDAGKPEASSQQWLFDPPARRDEVDAKFGSQPVLVDLKGCSPRAQPRLRRRLVGVGTVAVARLRCAA